MPASQPNVEQVRQVHDKCRRCAAVWCDVTVMHGTGIARGERGLRADRHTQLAISRVVRPNKGIKDNALCPPPGSANPNHRRALHEEAGSHATRADVMRPREPKGTQTSIAPAQNWKQKWNLSFWLAGSSSSEGPKSVCVAR